MAVKVIGAGFGRTGTKSLQCALEMLGVSPCYHMETLLQHPEDLLFWKCRPGQTINWGRLFANYQAVVDFPACLYAEELYRYYPGSKVILTTRDAESWYQSTRETIYISSLGLWDRVKLFKRALACRRTRTLRQVELFSRDLIWHRCFQGKFEKKSLAIKIYQEHIDRIKRVIPAEDLLCFDPTDGWQPLCEFLGLEVPRGQNFPSMNKRVDYHEWLRGLVVNAF